MCDLARIPGGTAALFPAPGKTGISTDLTLERLED
jgi:hypothetical protein